MKWLRLRNIVVRTLVAAVLLVVSVSLFAAPVGNVQTITGKARLVKNGNPETWEWVKVGTTLEENDVLQVAPNSSLNVQVQGKKYTIGATSISTIKVAQLLHRGDMAIRQQSVRPSRNNNVSTVAGVRASEVEGVELNQLSWLTEENSEAKIEKLVEYLSQLNDNGNYFIVLRVLNKYFANNEKNDALLVLYGAAQSGFGMFEESNSSLESVKDKAKFGEKIDFYLGLNAYKSGEIEVAQERLSQFGKKYTTSSMLPEVYLYLGYSYQELGNDASAKEYFTKAANKATNETTKNLANESLKK